MEDYTSLIHGIIWDAVQQCETQTVNGEHQCPNKGKYRIEFDALLCNKCYKTRLLKGINNENTDTTTYVKR